MAEIKIDPRAFLTEPHIEPSQEIFQIIPLILKSVHDIASHGVLDRPAAEHRHLEEKPANHENSRFVANINFTEPFSY